MWNKFIFALQKPSDMVQYGAMQTLTPTVLYRSEFTTPAICRVYFYIPENCDCSYEEFVRRMLDFLGSTGVQEITLEGNEISVAFTEDVGHWHDFLNSENISSC